MGSQTILVDEAFPFHTLKYCELRDPLQIRKCGWSWVEPNSAFSWFWAWILRRSSATAKDNNEEIVFRLSICDDAKNFGIAQHQCWMQWVYEKNLPKNISKIFIVCIYMYFLVVIQPQRNKSLGCNLLKVYVFSLGTELDDILSRNPLCIHCISVRVKVSIVLVMEAIKLEVYTWTYHTIVVVPN